MEKLRICILIVTVIFSGACTRFGDNALVNPGELSDGDRETFIEGVKGINLVVFDAPFDSPVVGYKLYSSGEGTQSDPAKWTLLGSDGGRKWEVIDSREGQSFCARFQEIYCPVTFPVKYKRYMLEFETADGSAPAISEVEFFDRDIMAGWYDFNYPEVDFKVTDPDTEGAALYGRLVQEPEEYVCYHARKVCEILFWSDGDPMYDVRKINYTLRNYDGISAKGGSPPEIYIEYSTRHVGMSAAESFYKLDYETRGVLFHELVHAYQHEPRGIGTYSTNREFWACIEGLADAVRSEAGFFDVAALRKPGGHWLDGYKTTGFFLQWLTIKDPDAIRKFHVTVRDLDVWSFDKAMKELFGEESGIEKMWGEYQRYLNEG